MTSLSLLTQKSVLVGESEQFNFVKFAAIESVCAFNFK